MWIGGLAFEFVCARRGAVISRVKAKLATRETAAARYSDAHRHRNARVCVSQITISSTAGCGLTHARRDPSHRVWVEATSRVYVWEGGGAMRPPTHQLGRISKFLAHNVKAPHFPPKINCLPPAFLACPRRSLRFLSRSQRSPPVRVATLVCAEFP